ncbi:MAG TPA: hypothetical protein VIO58_13180 [Candidatus Methanoperedens sp.]
MLIGGGWIAINTATAVMSFVALILFGRILNQFEIKNKALLLVTFAFIPIIWINSTITMDYMWALAFILLACFFIFTGRYSLAGIAIGFAIGTRFTSLLMVIPLVYWMYVKKVNIPDFQKFISTGILTSALIFLPVLHKYGLEFLQGSGFMSTTPVRESIDSITNSILLSSINSISEITGFLAFVLILVLMLLYKKSFPVTKNQHLLNFCWMVLILYGILYFIFPYKVAYLIPVIPWGLIILNEKLHKIHLVIICILLILNNIISIGIVVDDPYKLGIDSGTTIKNFNERKVFGINQSREYLESLSTILKEEGNFTVDKQTIKPDKGG